MRAHIGPKTHSGRLQIAGAKIVYAIAAAILLLSNVTGVSQVQAAQDAAEKSQSESA